MRRLAARAPDLEIFGQGLVLRDAMAWQLTEAGRALLIAIEKPAVEVLQQATENGPPVEPPHGRSDGCRRHIPIGSAREPDSWASPPKPDFKVIEGGKL
jgi:hypothetical protein